MTIASKFRLKGTRVIEEIKEKGRILQSDNFGFVYLKSSEKDFSRFAFVISTKISKLAVQRNRIDRAMSEAVRINMIIIPKGYDFVFLAKKSIATKTTEEIMKEVERFLSALKIN